MNSSVLRRLVSMAFASLTAAPLCVFLVMAAHAAPPAHDKLSAAAVAATAPPAAASPSSASPVEPSAASSAESSDDAAAETGHHRVKRHGRHHDWRDDREDGNNLVAIFHDSTLPQGSHADSVVSIFGSATSAGEAGDVVSVLGDTKVTGNVSDGAVSVLGNVYVDAKIGGDVVAVLGNVELGPHAEVDGDVVAVGGTLQRDAAAIIHGSVQNVLAGDFGSSSGLRIWIRHCLLYGRPLAWLPGLGWAWGLALTCLALYALLALLFREGLTRCVQTFEAQPGQSALAALIALLLTPVLLVLLCITVIGIPAVPFIVLALFCASLFGKAVILAWIGRRITGTHAAGPMSHPVFAVLIGGVVALALYTVPVLGFLVYKLLGFFGLGAVVYTLIVAARQRRTAKEGPRSQAAAFGPAPTPAAAPASGSTSASGTTTMPGPVPTPEPASTQAPPLSDAAAPSGPAAAAPVTAALPRAGFWVRIAALLLDALLVGFCLSVLGDHHLELLVLAAYGAVMWKLKGTTIGGLVFDLQIVRLDGRAVDWETAIIRALSCFLSLVVAGLGFIWIAFDDNKQAWHDKIAGTVVVRVAKGVPLV